MSETMPPWLYIVLGWVILLAAATVTIRVCQKNAPQSVVIENGLPSGTGHAR